MLFFCSSVVVMKNKVLFICFFCGVAVLNVCFLCVVFYKVLFCCGYFQTKCFSMETGRRLPHRMRVRFAKGVKKSAISHHPPLSVNSAYRPPFCNTKKANHSICFSATLAKKTSSQSFLKFQHYFPNLDFTFKHRHIISICVKRPIKKHDISPCFRYVLIIFIQEKSNNNKLVGHHEQQ